MRTDPDTTEERRAREEDAMYQLDVVVSLFAIMLVILVALASAASVAETRYTVEYETAEPEAPPFVLSSIQTPYRFFEIWAADGEGLFRIDRAAVVRELAKEPAGRAPGISGPGADAWMESFPDSPLEWRFRLNLHDRPETGWLQARHIAWDDEAALDDWATEEAGAVIFVWESARGRLPALSARLRTAMRPHRIVPFTSDTATLTITYARSNFAYDKVLRPY